MARESLGATADELPSAVCTLLGFGRVSQEMREIVEGRISGLVASGPLRPQGEFLVVEG